MHYKRWITAIILLPPLILLILKGGPVLLAILALLVSTLTLMEYYRIAFDNHSPPVPIFYPVWGYLNGAAVIIAAAAQQATLIPLVLILNLIGGALASLFRFPTSQDSPWVVAKQSLGLVYIPLSLSCAIWLYHEAAGPLWLLLLIGTVAMGDTAAFYVGSYWGRHKLCPAVSPKKTVEGALGGLAANVLFALLFNMIFLGRISVPACILFALVIGAVGQVGDLFESQFKRAAGIKDSGHLLPGHGGFLDRIDALLFAAPTAYLLKQWLLL